MSRDLEKTLLYQSVKTLLEEKNSKISLPQHKLYTLFSIAFQYTLYTATKEPGNYIIRIEDSMLAKNLLENQKIHLLENLSKRFFCLENLNIIMQLFI